MKLLAVVLATVALAAAAQPPDAAGWRERSDALFAQGDHVAALAAAEQARALDDQNPWSRFAWLRAQAQLDPVAARKALPMLLHAGVSGRLPAAEAAALDNALGWLCLDLSLDELAQLHFGRVPAGTDKHAESQAGLAIVALRAGDTRLALEYFERAEAAGTLAPGLAALGAETRYRHALAQFGAARDLRDANAAARALAVLDELRPNDAATHRARAELAELRGDASARERALRDLLAADPAAPGAGALLVENLLSQRRPAEALAVARERAPETLQRNTFLQAFERNWVPHLEAALAFRHREGGSGTDRLDAPQLELAWVGSSPGLGRYRLAVELQAPEAGRVAAGQPFGSRVALPAALPRQQDDGVGAWLHWAPRAGVVVELGHSPSGFAVDNVLGALRFQVNTEGGPVYFGIERLPVGDSLLSLAGQTDPATGRHWGGVVRNRAYVDGSVGDAQFGVYAGLGVELLDGRQTDENSGWQAGLGFWHRAASGQGWHANIGGNVTAFGYADNQSRFTLGHGGYFSPRHFLAIGPTIDLQGRSEHATFRIEGGLSWQTLREEAADFFPSDAALQAASGNPRYPGSSRDGLGARLAATVEWRVSDRAVAGLRLEGLRGEDYDEVRLQVYSRRWLEPVTEVRRDPPHALLPRDFHHLH